MLQWRLFPPLSSVADTWFQEQQSESLRKYLLECNLFESNQRRNQRKQAVWELLQLYHDWMNSDASARVFVFGSCRLGVHNDKTDIDLLIIGTCQITRHHFFNGFESCIGSLHPSMHARFEKPQSKFTSS